MKRNRRWFISLALAVLMMTGSLPEMSLPVEAETPVETGSSENIENNENPENSGSSEAEGEGNLKEDTGKESGSATGKTEKSAEEPVSGSEANVGDPKSDGQTLEQQGAKDTENTDAEPEAPAEAETFTLTVHYQDTNGTSLADDTTQDVSVSEEEQVITLDAPEIDKYKVQESSLSITIPAGNTEDLEHNVVYQENTDRIYGDDYVPGNGSVHSVLTSDKENPTIQTYSSEAVSLTSTLSMAEDSVYTGFEHAVIMHEFRVKTPLPDGGTVDFTSYGAWLSNAKKQTVTINGEKYLVLTGEENATAAMPGLTQQTLGIQLKNGTNGEKVEIETRSWLKGDSAPEEFKDRITYNVVSKIDKMYDIYAYSNNNGMVRGGEITQEGTVISGYYNRNTGAFYPTAAAKENAGDTDAVYGRVLIGFTTLFGYSKPHPNNEHYGPAPVGVERLDPTVPQTWSLDYRVDVDTDGTIVQETDPAYKPVFIDAKIISNSSKTGAINGRDLTLGGNISAAKGSYIAYTGTVGIQLSLTARNQYVMFTNNTLSGNDTGSTVNYSVVANEANRNYAYYGCTVASLFFVPCNPSDGENVKRTLTLQAHDLKVTGISGRTADDKREDNNTVTYGVARKIEPSGDGISQSISEYGSVSRAVNGVARPYLHLSVPQSFMQNAEITGVNQLLKFETSHIKMLNENAPTNEFGGNAKSHVVYACKPDGSTWSSREEMFSTHSGDLVYFDTLAAAEAFGTPVGILFEYRDGLLTHTGLTNRMMGKNTGKAGTAVVCLDTELWWNDNVNNTTFYGSNGTKVSNIPDPSKKIYASDGGTYKESTFPANKVKIEDQNGTKYGMTYNFIGYIYGGSAYILNGSNPSETATTTQQRPSWFTITNNERIVACKGNLYVRYDVEGEEDPMADVELYIDGIKDNQGKMQRVGNIYIADKNAKVTFDPESNSFMSSDPSFHVIEDIKNMVFHGGGEYAIYFTMHIGNEESLAGEPALGTDEIKMTIKPKDSNQVMSPGEHNYNYGNATWQFFPAIQKSSSIGVAKTPLDTVVAPNEEIGYRLTATSLKDDYENYSMIDVLPFNGDKRGTQLDGFYALKGDGVTVSLSTSEASIRSKFTLWYTTDEKIRTAGTEGGIPKASEIGSGFDPNNSLGVTWKQMASTETTSDKTQTITGTVTDGEIPTAIVLCGFFGRNERYSVSLSFEVQNDKHGNIFANNATSYAPAFEEDTVSTTTIIRVVQKHIDGNVWLDKNDDGIRGDDEPILPGIKVSLYDDETSELITQNVYGEAYGDVITDADGHYEFKDVPDGDLRVVYLPTEEQSQKYILSPFKEGSDDDVNSDFEEADEDAIKGKSEVLAMAPYQDMAHNNWYLIERKADLGLVPVYTVTIKKIDKFTEKVLPGVEFDLYDEEYKDNNETEPLETDIITSDEGTATLETRFRPGTYYLVETEPLEGYVPLDPIEIVATADSITFDGVAGEPDDKNNVQFIVENEYLFGDLVIEKTLEKWEDSSDATFVFSVKAVKNGETAYTDVASLTFSGPGTKTYTFTGVIPVGAEVTVKEEYSGSVYKAVGAQEVKVTVEKPSGEEDPATAKFTNTYDGTGGNKGSGILNTFTKDGESWVWTDDRPKEEER